MVMITLDTLYTSRSLQFNVPSLLVLITDTDLGILAFVPDVSAETEERQGVQGDALYLAVNQTVSTHPTGAQRLYKQAVGLATLGP